MGDSVLGVGAAIEEVLDRIEEITENEEDYPPIDPGVLVALEHIIGLFCVDVDDPQDCITAIEDELGEDIEENPFGLPPLISSTQIDPNDFDLDTLNAHFPILATLTSRLAAPDRVNCTYLKFSPPLNQTYYGRTSGPPRDNCDAAISRRNAAHVASGNLATFLTAQKLDEITGAVGYPAIRGREQQLIDSWMHDGRTRANVANIYRGVSVLNPLGCPYHLASNVAFGPLSAFTGIGTCP